MVGIRARGVLCGAAALVWWLAFACASGEEDLSPSSGGSGNAAGSTPDASAGAAGAAGSPAGGGGSGGGGAGGSGAGGSGGSAGSAGQAGADGGPDAAGGSGGSAGGGSNDTCPGQTLTLTGSPTLKASHSGGTPPQDDDQGSCGGGAAREAVYQFTAPSAGMVTVLLSTTAFDGVLYVRGACGDSASEIECQDAAGTNGTEKIVFYAQAGEDYFVFADGKDASAAGLYAVQVELAPAQAVDTCPGESVSWTGSGAQDRTAQASGDTSALWPNDTAQCASGSSGAPDGAYALTPDVDGILTLELAPTGWDAVLSLRQTCLIPATELACASNEPSGGKETLQVWATNGSTVHALVDGASAAASGPYTLSAVLSPQKPDEKCPGQTATLTGTNPMTWSVNGDTSKRWPDITLSCAAGSGAARDAVYALTAPATGLMSVKLTPLFWDAVLSVRTTCSGGTETCADANGASSIDTHDFVASGGTTYYLVVDGKQAGGAGAYTLEASLVPFPENDGCPGQALTVSSNTAQVSADTSQLYDDFSASCAPVTGARDAVYRVVAPATGTMNVVMSPQGWDGALYVKSSCTASGTLMCNDSNGTNGNEYASVPVTQGSTYWIVVDGTSTTGGPFTLTATF